MDMNTEDLARRVRSLSSPLAPLPTGRQPSGRTGAPVRAVLFDIYGTLLISGSGDVGTAEVLANEEALEKAFPAAGLPPNPRAAQRGVELFFESIRACHAKKSAAGITVPEVEVRSIWQDTLERLHREGLLDAPKPSADIAALAIEYECRVNPVWLMPGALDLLRDLREHALFLGIVSNAQFYTPIILEALLDTSLEGLGFDPALCAWSYCVGEAKPSPALFTGPLKVLDDKGIDPDKVLYVGNDMLNDISTAVKCGMQTCLFAGDRRSLRERADRQDVAGIVPDLVITELLQLPEHLAIDQTG